MERATAKEWLVVLAGIFGAFMAVLNISIAVSCVREMQGSLNITLEETSWINISYAVAEIIVIPIFAWLIKVFSPRRYILVNCFLFVLSSFACGLASNLNEMIVARLFQGLSGGALIPMASYLVVTTLPLSQRTLGLALMGLAVSLGPSLGPTLGGWLAVNYSWRLAFYVQVIPGAAMTALIWSYLAPQPANYSLLRDGDWIGIATMIVGLACLTYVLEEGNRLDWFSDDSIIIASTLCALTLPIFLYRQLVAKNPFIGLRLLGSRYFALCCCLSLVNGLFTFGTAFVLPRYLIQIQSYDALQIGLLAAWVGLPQVLISPLIPFISKKIPGKWLIAFGFGILAVSSVMNASLSNLTGAEQLIWPQLVRGIGQVFIVGPLTAFAFQGTAPENLGSVSSLFAVARQFGATLSVCVVGIVVDHQYHVHFSNIATSVSTESAAPAERLASLSELYFSGTSDSSAFALQLLSRQLNRESFVLAYADTYLLLAIPVALACLTVVLMKPRRTSPRQVPNPGK